VRHRLSRMARHPETCWHEGSDDQARSPLRDLYAGLDRPGARTGVQFPRRPAEACEAYIKSQAHEGWRLVRDRYDDGSFSGGSMDRPALQKLLIDVQARRIRGTCSPSLGCLPARGSKFRNIELISLLS
jgi:hypothetical protein